MLGTFLHTSRERRRVNQIFFTDPAGDVNQLME